MRGAPLLAPPVRPAPGRPEGARALSQQPAAAVPLVALVDVDAANWRDVVAVRPRAEQERWVAPVSYYLCLSHYGGTWQPLAVVRGGAVVGHVMWAVDDSDGSHWVGGLVIAGDVQGQGVGGAVMRLLLDRFTATGAREAALSYAPENSTARALYAALGFVETGEREDDEVVARRRLR